MTQRIVYVGYALSGFVALGYQVVWFRVFIDRFGSTNLTLILVLTSFLGGLGAGALASRWVASRLGRLLGWRDPLRLYGAVEILLVLAAALTLAVKALPGDLWGSFPYELAGGIYRRTMGYELAQAGIGIAAVFLPCFFMGVTFPLLVSGFPGVARFPSALYGWNTLGATSGILACEFFFLPRMGHGATFLVLLAANAAIGLFFVLGGARWREAAGEPVAGATRPGAAPPQLPHAFPAPLALACAALSGFLCGALEGDMFKRLWLLDCTSGAALSFISFWAILAIFLASWTVKAMPRLTLRRIQLGYFATLAVYLAAWKLGYPLRRYLAARETAGAAPSDPLGYYHYQPGPLGLLFFVGVFVFLAYFLSSFLLPYVCNRLHADRRHLGLAYGLNTVCFCLGLVTFSWIAPRVSVFYSLKLFPVAFAILVVALFLMRPERAPARWLPGAAAAALLLAALAVPRGFDPRLLDPRNPAARCPVRAMRSNGAHTTYVVEDPDGASLYFDHFSMSGTSRPDQRYMRLMAHFPLLAHPRPERALLLCFGVGTTASAIAAHETIRQLDIVELNDRVYETAPEFTATNRGVQADPRVSLIHDDGRSFLRASGRRYDLITSEPPPPMDEGIYRLYSREYYRAALDHLTPDGLMTQWLPVYQMSPEAVGLAVSTFVGAFPRTLLFAGSRDNFILVGSRAEISLERIAERFGASEPVAADLAAVDVGEALGLVARVVKGDRSLRRDYAGCDQVSDERNQFSYLRLDPRRPAVVTYDPLDVLEETGTGRLLGARRQRLRAAVTNLARLKEVVPDFPPTTLATVAAAPRAGEVAFAGAPWAEIDALNLQALRAQEEARWEDCIGFCRRSLALVDEQAPVVGLLAETQMLAGHLEDGVTTWRRYQELEPESGRGEYGMGLGLFHLGRYEEAVPHLRRAGELEPGSALPWHLLGDLFARVGRYAEAVAAYDRALALEPGLAAAREGRAAALAQLPLR